ncbi:ABC transporter permease [uncultured Agrococcus sp.]|uniref:ABC transporter permease n=1 Tax=uncultured Agrococcus sp. TaxID=382258 RepID=UPI0025DC6874|nr:ABC transporter permease [uncultured Agrococcus sp.]
MVSTQTVPVEHMTAVTVRPKKRRLSWTQRFSLWGSLGYLAAFFVIPVGALVLNSFQTVDGWTLTNYAQVLSDGYYLGIFWETVRIGFISTTITILLSYPVAAFISRLSNRGVALVMVFVILPYFTNTVVRTFAWIVILGREGALNSFLIAAGIIPEPLQMLYNELGVMVGLVYVFLPLAILIQFAVMRGIDTNLLRAAETMGASKVRAFFKVYLPLSLPGTIAAALLVFIECVGAYITPALMGGQGNTMVAQIIERQVRMGLDFGTAAAVVVILGVVVSGIYVLYDRITGMTKLFEDNS